HSLSGRTQGATARHVTTPTPERGFSTEWPERLWNSEPRPACNKTLVTRYRIFPEQARYASSTINLRLAASSPSGL
ncbi:MAG: hypothetical protein ABUS51_06020, partial [Acidobacteriota bacterium]